MEMSAREDAGRRKGNGRAFMACRRRRINLSGAALKGGGQSRGCGKDNPYYLTDGNAQPARPSINISDKTRAVREFAIILTGAPTPRWEHAYRVSACARSPAMYAPAELLLTVTDTKEQAERQHLLYGDPYAQNGNGYGTYTGQASHGIPPQNVMSPEEVKREQEALQNITRWAGEQVVEIFPHAHRNTMEGSSSGASNKDKAMHHDILLSMIPGDKSKKSIRIYPASRPESAASARSKASSKRLASMTLSRDSSVFVPLNVDLT